jgi:hypothetical protein
VCGHRFVIRNLYGAENRRDKSRRRIMARSEYQQATNKEFGELHVNIKVCRINPYWVLWLIVSR